MKKTFFLLVTIILVISACTKVEKTPTSGTATIDNTVFQSATYFVYGFSFSEAKLVSNLANPGSDIIVFVNTDNIPYRLTFQADNLKPSFYKVGDYSNEAAARQAFDNLSLVEVARWEDMADPISVNQVWIYRSGRDTYAKIRIVSTVNEIRQNIPYGECTFQWVYQPDGSLTFKGK
jgi:hypothetical protein